MEEFAFYAAIFILIMTFGWTIFNLSAKTMRRVSFTLLAILLLGGSAALITNREAINFILSDSFFYPLICVWLLLFLSAVFFYFDFKNSNAVFLTTFVGGLLVLLFGFELQKISLNTWKGLLPAIAALNVLTAILILQAITYLSPARNIFGILKLLAGIVSLAIILLQYLQIFPPIKPDASFYFSRYVIFASIFLIAEGLLIIYKAKKETHANVELI